jgi:hypothetical protein
MPNVRKRTGGMGTLSTREPATSTHAVLNTVSTRGCYFKTNEAKPILNSVAMRPKNVGASKVENAGSWPGKFSM